MGSVIPFTIICLSPPILNHHQITAHQFYLHTTSKKAFAGPQQTTVYIVNNDKTNIIWRNLRAELESYVSHHGQNITATPTFLGPKSVLLTKYYSDAHRCSDNHKSCRDRGVMIHNGSWSLANRMILSLPLLQTKVADVKIIITVSI